MTAMTGVPAQQIGVASPRVAANNKDAAAKEPAQPEKAEGFDSVFSRVEAEKGASSRQPQTARGNEGELQPRRPRDVRPKALQAEEAVPAELLQALAPQQPAVPLPVAPTLPLDFAALTASPAVPGETVPELLPGLPVPMGKVMPGTGAIPLAGAAPVLPADPFAALAAAMPPVAEDAPLPASAVISPQRQPQQLVAAAAQAQQSPVLPKEAAPSLRQGASRAAETADRMSLAVQAMADGQEMAETLAKQPAPPPDRIGEMGVTVTRQETILPPAVQTPPIQQAADRIMGELAAMAEELAPQEAPASRRESELAPMRVLHLQLDPPELGVLTVKLALRDNALVIQVAAEEPGTARLLEKDRERLSDMLRSAGYGVEGVTVQIVTAPERSQPGFQAMMGGGGDNPAQYGSGAQSHSGGAQADAQRGHQSRRGNEEWASPAPGGNDRAGPLPGSADGDLYL